MNMIAAVDRQMGIGKDGKLLVSIPLDQQTFRKRTIGKVVVMGRKTLETLPQKQPLSQRDNIILSAKPSYQCRHAYVAHSMEEAQILLEKYDSDDIYIIGGESVYKQFLPLADRIYLTEIDYTYHADSFFPKLDPDEWVMVEESDEQTYFDLIYYFRVYERKKK